MAPHPQACVIVCSVLVACGNWAQAQGELTVCTNTRWEWGGEWGTERLGKLDPEPRTVSFLEMQEWALVQAVSGSGHRQLRSQALWEGSGTHTAPRRQLAKTVAP